MKEPKLTVYMSLSVADAKDVFNNSMASNSERGVTESCSKLRFLLSDAKYKYKKVIAEEIVAKMRHLCR